MPDREVLTGRTAPGLALLTLGLALVVLGAIDAPDVSVLLIGLFWSCVGAFWFATRHTVLDADGIRPAGSRRSLPWSEVLDVRRSRSALRYADVELEVRGLPRPVHVHERRGGADLEAVRSHWLAATGGGDGPGVGPAREPDAADPPGRAGPA